MEVTSVMPTVIAAIGVVGLVTLVIRSMIRDAKQGNLACRSCSNTSCALRGK